MNDNTRRQWERYCQESSLSLTDRFVLYWLVHDHSAREGFTRPGVSRLAYLTGGQPATIVASLRRLAAADAIELKDPGRGRLAALWTIPWLVDVPLRNRSGNRSGNRSTSTPLRGVRAPAVNGGRARHPSFAEQFQAKPRPEIADHDDCAPDQFLIR